MRIFEKKETYVKSWCFRSRASWKDTPKTS